MKKVKIYGWTELAGGTRLGRIMYQKRPCQEHDHSH